MCVIEPKTFLHGAFDHVLKVVDTYYGFPEAAFLLLSVSVPGGSLDSHSSSFSDKTKKNEKEQATSGQVVSDDEETFFGKIKKKIFG